MKTLRLYYGDRTKIKASLSVDKYILTIESEVDSKGDVNPNSKALEYDTEEELFKAFNEFTK